ncbi:MAG: hypothetical protein J4F41_00015 [Alphaproteobacteria bacterium]|nr:hypothetical protein [Alphaproteobacteria bacterium]
MPEEYNYPPLPGTNFDSADALSYSHQIFVFGYTAFGEKEQVDITFAQLATTLRQISPATESVGTTRTADDTAFTDTAANLTVTLGDGADGFIGSVAAGSAAQIFTHDTTDDTITNTARALSIKIADGQEFTLEGTTDGVLTGSNFQLSHDNGTTWTTIATVDAENGGGDDYVFTTTEHTFSDLTNSSIIKFRTVDTVTGGTITWTVPDADSGTTPTLTVNVAATAGYTATLKVNADGELVFTDDADNELNIANTGDLLADFYSNLGNADREDTYDLAGFTSTGEAYKISMTSDRYFLQIGPNIWLCQTETRSNYDPDTTINVVYVLPEGVSFNHVRGVFVSPESSTQSSTQATSHSNTSINIRGHRADGSGSAFNMKFVLMIWGRT